ncbi:AAA family ATPase [Acidiphilium sp. AL]|uniref:AAA family ATPase n=1 Tax=Acidiphilium iwatense TaxID=768198 RepID=A0ABS9E066_9PROT|nr:MULTISPECIES: AAA family ATPase [Acidiphilium]MCF3948397.1 AAA family ATPase [Acidiphilium iwatense]MCU4161146.1 AAA family ATPase [Acidiphilium sp. AL]
MSYVKSTTVPHARVKKYRYTELVVALGGLPGAGKSVLANRLLRPLTIKHRRPMIISSDQIRKHIFGVAPTVRLPPEASSDHATDLVHEAIVAHVAARIGVGPTIVVATFRDPGFSDVLQAATDRQQGQFVGFWIDTPIEVLEARFLDREDDVPYAMGTLHEILQEGIARPSEWIVIEGGDLEKGRQRILTTIKNGWVEFDLPSSG